MASKRLAKKSASKKSKQVFRTNIKKPKKQVVKKFANFVGKVTYKVVKAKRRFKRRFKKRSFKKRYKRRRRY